MQAIEKAAEAAPKGIKGFFEVHVKAIGKPHEVVFLNSELDYRDPRNISIAIHPKVVEPFKEKYGEVLCELPFYLQHGASFFNLSGFKFST
jgi:hypothetical protein